jgi:hypothetical protein
LWYIKAMIYHDRSRDEYAGLDVVMGGSVRSDPRRRELNAMTQSYADFLIEKGRAEGAVSAL